MAQALARAQRAGRSGLSSTMVLLGFRASCVRHASVGFFASQIDLPPSPPTSTEGKGGPSAIGTNSVKLPLPSVALPPNKRKKCVRVLRHCGFGPRRVPTRCGTVDKRWAFSFVGDIPNYTKIEPKVAHFTAFLGQRERSTSAV